MSSSSQKVEWFGTWFDSPYYHILYRNRDNKEAKIFIDAITDFLELGPGMKVLDIACGKGRHSKYLESKGLTVTGIDLSAQNIKSAKHLESDRLHFEIHDMRQPFAHEQYDAAFNLFTSFGYFETQDENQNSINNAADALIVGGKLVVDFLNSYKVVTHLIPAESKVVDQIDFNIERFVDNQGYIVKDISFLDNGEYYHFVEKVKAIRLTEFKTYFLNAGLEIVQMFGDYELGTYDRDKSDRMIFVLKKLNDR